VALLTEAFTEPFVNLRCEAGVAMSGHLVNVTWTTKDNQLPNDVRPHLQNCQASIDCTNGYSREVCEILQNKICIAKQHRVVVHTLPVLV